MQTFHLLPTLSLGLRHHKIISPGKVSSLMHINNCQCVVVVRVGGRGQRATIPELSQTLTLSLWGHKGMSSDTPKKPPPSYAQGSLDGDWRPKFHFKVVCSSPYTFVMYRRGLVFNCFFASDSYKLGLGVPFMK